MSMSDLTPRPVAWAVVLPSQPLFFGPTCHGGALHALSG